jgi:hypothetical protein
LVLQLLEYGGEARPPYTDLDSLQVVAVCDCGCGSFETVRSGSVASSTGLGRILADGYGTVDEGEAVGLILRGTEESVTFLEVYSLAHDPPYAALPSPLSVSAVPRERDPTV